MKLMFRFLVCLAFLGSATARSQDAVIDGTAEQAFLMPGEALDRIQESHSEESPIVVAQGELDQLIDCKGGGACPISAALIASQGVREMAGLPADPRPHRTALRVFRDKPELLLGRISNDRMVILLA